MPTRILDNSKRFMELGETRMLKRIAISEIILGFLSTILLTLKFGWCGVLLSCITSVLWALGGTYKKWIRRIGVPLSAYLMGVLVDHSSIATLMYFPIGWLILSIGDGYPDTFSGDPGSWLGRQVKKLGFSDSVGGLVTKIIPVILLQLAWVPILFPLFIKTDVLKMVYYSGRKS